ncbi:MAG: adenylosuccinate synthetase [Parcubacteria group bacterium]|nr:adenylosuccinate synthetase [Parcubacteria group bacterium]
MTRKAFIVTGLGYGDEGKGTTTHWLSRKHKAHTVIRTGGPQALHHVVCRDGREHVFSQFGSGTFEGAGTHLSKHMLVDPAAILKEEEWLREKSGVRGALDIMTIHEDALVITPFQAIAGRVRELMRGQGRRGSVGIGVGETVLDSEVLNDGAIRIKDLHNTDLLREKLEAIQRCKWTEFEEFADRASTVPPDVRHRVLAELADMEDSDTVEWAVERFGDLVGQVRIVDDTYVAEKILGREGTVVFEGSQGVLLDRYQGFHPHTTKVRTIPQMAQSILRECDYDGAVQSLGILRAYHTRHGGGPFVTEASELALELPDAVNKEHPWQGNFRVGHFDMLAARYALEACGPGAIDDLVITCLDRIWSRGSWQVCDAYDIVDNVPDAEHLLKIDRGIVTGIKARKDAEGAEHLQRQEKLGQALLKCRPKLTTHVIPSGNAKESFIDLCVSTIQKNLGVPVAAVSIGPTEQDKIDITKGQ